MDPDVNSSEIRQESKMAADDPSFSVRVAGVAELVRMHFEAKVDGSSATWSSEVALASQVAADTKAILIPTIRNGGPVTLPETWRCHVWFVDRDLEPTVSMLDVRRDTFLALRELTDRAQLNKVVRLLVDGYRLSALS
ncbi:hypothetical protein ACIBSW_22270 [Actinoplanes sp. NPDC049668]|uniref:hypothetical protein n=1 Tax=unclassified Actinoplanes TaxID=2626549 RepID=UPI0033BECB78